MLDGSLKLWRTAKKESEQCSIQNKERTEYGSEFVKLGAKMHPVHLGYSESKARRPLGLHQMTEQQFINEGTSDSEAEDRFVNVSRQQPFGMQRRSLPLGQRRHLTPRKIVDLTFDEQR